MNNYQSIRQSPRNALKTTKLIHLALLAGQVMFAIVAFSISNKQLSFVTKDKENDIFLYLVPLFAIGGFVVGNFIAKKILASFMNKETLTEKLAGYQTALIVKCALLESASLMGIVAFLLTNNWIFLLIAIAIMFYFFTLHPTVDKVTDDLQLSYEEKAELGV